jgi:hypothetical protein
MLKITGKYITLSAGFCSFSVSFNIAPLTEIKPAVLISRIAGFLLPCSHQLADDAQEKGEGLNLFSHATRKGQFKDKGKKSKTGSRSSFTGATPALSAPGQFPKET